MIKKKMFAVMVMCTILFEMMIPIISKAEQIIGSSDNRFKYEVLSDGSIEITDYIGTDTEVVIPESIDGYKVTRIGYMTFQGCSSLTSVSIPEGVTIIREYAFDGCSRLTSVSIPVGVTHIRTGAFRRCSNLASISIPNSVISIESEAFSDCSSLTSISIPNSVTSMGAEVFNGCSSLTSIEVAKENENYVSENGVVFTKDKTQIKYYPAGKAGKEYVIQNSVTSIGSYAFNGCSSLTSISIPDGVIGIGDGAFRECSNLTSINIPDGVTRIGDEAFYGCNRLTSINIPDGVTRIGDEAFYGCSRITSINIPDRVTSIERYAFYGCSSLTSINIPNSVTRIGVWAFRECGSLTSISIPDSVTNIGSGVFNETTIIYAKADSEAHRYAEEAKQGYILDGIASNISTNYEIKEEVEWDISEAQDGTVIAKWTRSNKTIVITGTGKTKNRTENSSEDYKATQYKYAIEKVIIKEGVTSIGTCSFSECSKIISVSIPVGVTSIGSYAFSGCSSLTSVSTQEGITSIGSRAFYGCSSLTSIRIPTSVTSIGGYTFYGCSSLTSVSIPYGVTSIGISAFEKCSSLTSINIPDGVTSIEEYAFYGCRSLTSVNISDSVTSIISTAFRYCSSLINIEVAKDNNNYLSENGIVFSKDKKRIICYPEGKEEKVYVIPDGVTTIEDYAFYECSNLTSVSIPESVTSIEDLAFFGCSSLTSVSIPDGVFSIGDRAFYKCSSLTNINIPASVTSIAESLFLGCSSLTSISIPDRVTSIGDYAFSDCYNLIIKCKSGTVAQEYANSNNIECEIDDVVPTLEVVYSTTELTNQDVQVTITSNEEIQKIDGWILSDDELSLTKTYALNAKEEIQIKDLVGNITKAIVEIDNIDKKVPEVEVEYNVTVENVEVKIKANEQVQKIAGWTLAEDKLSLSKTYTTNAKEQIEVKDLAGNECIVEIRAVIKANLQINNEIIKGEWIYNIGANVTRENLEKRIKADVGYTLKNTKGTELNTADIIGTGTTIEFVTKEKYTFIIIGDLDGDGQTSANDLLKMKRQVVGMSNYELQGAFKEAADTNLDASINATDLLRIKRAVVGLINL